MTTALLSLGSNMGDSQGLLRAAVAGLGPAVRSTSSVYRTPPWGPVAQDDFLNIAVLVDDPAVDAYGWLDRCHGIEQAAHRERHVRWGPRTLDADVVAVWTGNGEVLGAAIISDDPALTLPHPRAHERGFVLVPWAEIQAGAILPGYGRVVDLIAAMDVSAIERVGVLGAGSLGAGVLGEGSDGAGSVDADRS